jgi:hypothetical protein
VLGAIIASPVAGFIKAYYEEFYLARVPPSPDLPAQVEGMLDRTMPGEEAVAPDPWPDAEGGGPNV